MIPIILISIVIAYLVGRYSPMPFSAVAIALVVLGAFRGISVCMDIASKYMLRPGQKVELVAFFFAWLVFCSLPYIAHQIGRRHRHN